MTISLPKYHWQFTEKTGHIARDVSGVESRFHKVGFEGHGRIGHSVKLSALDSRITLHGLTERFGTSDFTVAFGIKILNSFNQNDTDIIGNRNVPGHGNWFSLRLQDQGKILFFEVDENSSGKNYAIAKTKQLSSLVDQKWHHVALVRQETTLKIYFDGALVQTGKSRTGVANIISPVDIKLGHYTRHTPAAQYEDLRIYHTALSDAEIKALVPPVNRPLREGEIELVAADNAAMILNQNIDDLSHFSNSFKQLRVGNNTGVTLYQQTNFGGIAQKCHADLPDMRLSRIKTFPKSIRIWSTVGEPFTGKWMIKAPNGQFLSLGKNRLTTAPQQGLNALFKFHYNLQQAQLQLIPGADQESDHFSLSSVETPARLFVDDSDSLPGEFSLINPAKNEWLSLTDDNTFSWTQQKESRAVFVRAVKFANNEGQVGELASGEVALYEHVAYHGKTWILSDSAKDVSGEHKRFGNFQGLNDLASSIRLGPDTGVTLFKHFNYRVAEGKREEEIEDIVKNVPDLRESQIGDDALSSVKIFRTIEPEDVFSSYTSKLSQDYRMVGDNLEEFSSYRTILRFKPGAGEIEVSATDLTQIEVEGTTYDIDEVRSVTLSPNELNLIMITSEADGLNTPGLKIRTSDMAPNERVVIFPNREAHKQIAELEDGALWNAKDAKGNLIVDRNAHSKEEVASAQNTIKRVMATVNYGDDAPAAQALVQSTATSAVQSTAKTSVQSDKRGVSGATIEKPWELTLGSNGGNIPAPPEDGQQSVIVQPIIAERPVSSDEWQQLLAQATPGDEEDSPEANGPVASGPVTFGTARVFSVKKFGRRLGRKFKKAIKKATSVVIGKVKDVVHVVVKTIEAGVEKVVDFVVDTVEKVADFVEGVVETVVKAIKQFIEFLQFLFDWGDILDTQQYLKRTINANLDSAKQLAADAKPHVKGFVDDLQNSVEDGMNQLVKTLGGKPSEVKESGFEFPEALEWFLSKLMGGSKSSESDTTQNSGGGDSPLERFMRHLLEAFEDAIGAGLRLSEGVLGSIHALIKNPRQPEVALIVIIEALRDAIIQSLDAVENVALGLLDVVAMAVDLFKNLLNAEIRIPFISALLDFIGVGKLTVINLATMVLAIPATVTSKLVTGQNLFTNKTPVPLDLAKQRQTPLAFASVTTESPVLSKGTDTLNISNSTDETDDPESIKDLRKDLAFTIIVTVADTVNHLIAGLLDLLDVPGFDEPDSKRKFSKIDKKLGDEAKKRPNLIQGLEITSIVLSFISWSFSYPSQFERGAGAIFGKDKDRRERAEISLEITLWSYRGTLLALDTVCMLFSGFERMRRVEKKLNIMWAILNILDMILFSAYLAVVEEDNLAIKRADISNEVFSALPNILSFVRSLEIKEPITATVIHLGHVGTDIAAAIVTATTGGILIREADQALREAKATA
ncbi:MAG: LamG domain-containing protein [Leptolyngbya sp. SIO3F4]|nr:LamG domain-containing protein [Leptolyngbya sp. SIO3F4]